MTKLLQKVKAIFNTPEAPQPKAAKKTKPKRKPKKVTTEKEIETLGQLKQDIKANGYRSMKVSSLFGLFNYQKRSTTNVDKVIDRLAEEGLFVSKMKIKQTDWNKRIRIYTFPMDQLGDVFSSEKAMEDAFAVYEWFKLLDLKINTKPQNPGERSDRQFSPDGTKDRLDFRALDNNGNHVVLELKHKGGDNRLIEQVLRYRTDLRRHFKDENVRCIVITGERCLNTAKAIWALPPHEKQVINWYLYKWDKNDPEKIEFREVALDFIGQHLAPANENLTEQEVV